VKRVRVCVRKGSELVMIYGYHCYCELGCTSSLLLLSGIGIKKFLLKNWWVILHGNGFNYRMIDSTLTLPPHNAFWQITFSKFRTLEVRIRCHVLFLTVKSRFSVLMVHLQLLSHTTINTINPHKCVVYFIELSRLLWAFFVFVFWVIFLVRSDNLVSQRQTLA